MKKEDCIRKTSWDDDIYWGDINGNKVMGGEFMYYTGGKPFTGIVERMGGHQQGISEYFENGILVVQYYKNGNVQYKWDAERNITKYFENGQLQEEGDYKDGKKDGVWKGYFESGQLQEEGDYKDGKKDGVWKGYFESGQLKSQVDYKEGKKVGISKEWYENGELRGMKKDGEKIGVWTEYLDNGRKLVNDGKKAQYFEESGWVSSEYWKIDDKISNHVWDVSQQLERSFYKSGKLKSAQRIYPLIEGLIIEEEWYESGIRKKVSVPPFPHADVEIEFDKSGSIIEEENNNSILERFAIFRKEYNAHSIDEDEEYTHIEIEYSLGFQYRDDEDEEWEIGEVCIEGLISFHVNEDGAIGTDFDKIEMDSAKAEDYYSLEDLEDLFNGDIERYGVELKKLFNLEKIQEEIRQYIKDTNEESETDITKTESFKQELINYIKKEDSN